MDQNTITRTTKSGYSVRTSYTDQEAYDLASKVKDHILGQELTSKSIGSLSFDQMTVLHGIAVRSTTTTPVIGDIGKIIDIFDNARQGGIKSPSIWISTNLHNIEVRVYEASKTGTNPGHLYVRGDGPLNKGDYYGKITPKGQFLTTDLCSTTILDSLTLLAQDPKKAIEEYGKLTGRCAMCHRRMNDPRSLKLNYGPVCAKRMGFVWGLVDTSPNAEVASRLRRDTVARGVYRFTDMVTAAYYGIEQRAAGWAFFQAGTPETVLNEPTKTYKECYNAFLDFYSQTLA